MQTKKNKEERFLSYSFFILCYLRVSPCPAPAPAGALRTTRAPLGEKSKTFWKKIGIEITEDNNTAEVQMNIS